MNYEQTEMRPTNSQTSRDGSQTDNIDAGRWIDQSRSNIIQLHTERQSSIILNIQALRAFAALNVVFFHVIAFSVAYDQSVVFFRPLEGWGANGVDVFFVISGFVMAYTQSINPKKPSEFIKNRIFRIVPLYWILTTFYIILYILFSSSFREMQINFNYALQSYIFLSQAIVGASPVLGVGWTLEWEMLFYVIFALSLLFKDRKIAYAAVFLSLFLTSWLASTLLVLEFALGMAIAAVFVRLRLPNFAGWSALSLGALLLVLSIGYAGDVDRFFKWGIPSAFIVLGALYISQTKNSLLIYLGASSYSIYLVHIFLVSAFYKFFSLFESRLNTDFLAIVCFSLSLAIGCTVYSIVERPITKFLERDRWRLVPRS